MLFVSSKVIRLCYSLVDTSEEAQDNHARNVLCLSSSDTEFGAFS